MKKLNVKLKNKFLELFALKSEKDQASFTEKSNYYFEMTEVLYRLFKENIVLSFNLLSSDKEEDKKQMALSYSEKEQEFLENIDTIAITLGYEMHYESEESIECLKDIEETYHRNLDIEYLKSVFEKY